MTHPYRGFTLIEVLVALVILAVTIATMLRSAAIATDNTLALRERTLARWIAANQLARMQLQPSLPAQGETSGKSSQANLEFAWVAVVENTPNPDFRRVKVSVRAAGSPNNVAEVQGFAVAGR